MRTTSLKNIYGDSLMKYLLFITLVLFPSIHSYAYSHEGEIDLREGATTSISLKPIYIRNLTQTSGISVLNYNWRSTNTTVCSVTSSSLTTCTIRADRAGTAEIQYDCSFMWDGYYRTFAFKWDVTVEASTVFVTQIDFDSYSMSLFEGQSDRIVASVYPTNATNRSVTWSSNRSSVASVTQSGWVTANSVGTATITCSADDGSGVYETCLVTVLSSIVYVTDIELNKTSLSLTTGGSSQQLSATITPSNASNKNVSWTSSDTNVANVSSDGLVSPVSAGECIITCMAKDGSGVSRTCSIIVSPSRVPVSTINLNQTTASLFVDGPTLQLTATVLPDNATDRSVTWSSSNEEVATVSESGLVEAVRPGTATITCMAKDGSGVKAECVVTVKWTNAEIRLMSFTCDNADLNQLTNSDVLKAHATFHNSGETDVIYTRLVLFNEAKTKVVASSNNVKQSFEGGARTIVDYEYALDTIPEGRFFATAMYYNWNENTWFYTSSIMKEININSGKDDPEEKVCEKPTIHYQNGKLTFKCATEGVEFISEITDSDIKNNYTASVDLSVTYQISVYATKDGYTNSETAKATLCWIDVEPQKEGITEEDEDAVAQVKAVPVLIQAEGNRITISGATPGTPINVYDLNGRQLSTTTAAEGETRVNVGTNEKMVMVKVGERAVKIVK